MKFLSGLAAITLVLAATAAAQPILDLPPRAIGAPTGSEFKTQIESLEREPREDAICAAISAGNIPDWLRNFKPVTFSTTIAATTHEATIYVLPDYLGVGSNDDFFRTPMTPILGQQLADLTGTLLTTRRMTDLIWDAAETKVAPSPIPPSPAMTTVPVFWDHNITVEGQLDAVGAVRGRLTAGHKKDVVITPQLYLPQHANKVAIYGWHQLNGVRIQPLYLGHVDWYADYSHGVRLVASEMILDGQETTVQEVLGDPALAPILSDEGVIDKPRYPIAIEAAFPLIDHFPSTGRDLETWADRFVTHTVVPHTPASPEGDGFVLLVRDPSGGIDTARIGSGKARDYFVEADIYCEYRPELSANGFERVGIFFRDDGNGLFEGSSLSGIKGNCYALTWDSSNGRIQCLRNVNGVAVDLLPEALFQTGTAWRNMRIEGLGSTLLFYIDDQLILETNDDTHAAGVSGIGYHEYFTTLSNVIGTRADNFRADTLGEGSVGNIWGCY